MGFTGMMLLILTEQTAATVDLLQQCITLFCQIFA